eukprot:scaffold56214_cov69-Phaeocystis_antarctica.AAC.2
MEASGRAPAHARRRNMRCDRRPHAPGVVIPDTPPDSPTVPQHPSTPARQHAAPTRRHTRRHAHRPHTPLPHARHPHTLSHLELEQLVPAALALRTAVALLQQHATVLEALPPAG